MAAGPGRVPCTARWRNTWPPTAPPPIGFDLLFAEAATRREVDAADWEALAALAQSADLAEVRGELARRIEALQPGLGDREFVASVARAGNVFQAAVFAPGPPGMQDLPAVLAPPVPVAARAEASLRGQALLPFADLAQASRGIGHINALPDVDGTYRRFAPLLWQADRQAAYPSLGLAIAAHVKGVPLASLRRTAEGLAVGDAVLPLASDDSAWIRYQGGTLQRAADGSETFRSFYRHIPYEQVLAAKDLRAAGQRVAAARRHLPRQDRPRLGAGGGALRPARHALLAGHARHRDCTPTSSTACSPAASCAHRRLGGIPADARPLPRRRLHCAEAALPPRRAALPRP
jgi:hypothetical protein